MRYVTIVMSSSGLSSSICHDDADAVGRAYERNASRSVQALVSALNRLAQPRLRCHAPELITAAIIPGIWAERWMFTDRVGQFADARPKHRGHLAGVATARASAQRCDVSNRDQRLVARRVDPVRAAFVRENRGARSRGRERGAVTATWGRRWLISGQCSRALSRRHRSSRGNCTVS